MVEDNTYIGGIYKRKGETYMLVSFNLETNSCSFIPFSGNTLVGATINPVEEKHLCYCVGELQKPTPNCIVCSGSGVYRLPPKLLFSHFIFVAPNMREFLIKKFVD